MNASNNRALNSAKSLLWSVIFNLVTSGMPFVVRTLLLYRWGYEYAGLNSLFASVLNILNITELGIGEALVFSLYKPMAEGDVEKANAILNFYKKLYTLIGVVIAVIGVVIVPLLPYLIKGSAPADINLTLLYMISLSNTVGSYLVLAYCHTIFQTNQSLYLTVKYCSFNFLIMYLIQIMIILTIHNYYLFAIVHPVFTVLSHCINYILVKKYYPQYRPQGKVDKIFVRDFRKRVVGMVIRKLRNQFRGAIDNVIISAFMGLVILTKFQNYYLIMTVPLILIASFKNSILQSLGNSVASESIESNYAVVRLFVFCIQWIGCVFGTVLLGVYHSLILTWLRDDTAVFSYGSEILFFFYFYLTVLTNVTDLVRNGTGIWWNGKWIPVLETAVNLVLDIVGVQIWGINGVLAATIISLIFVNIPFETWCVYKSYFKMDPIKDILKYALDGGVNFVIAISVFVICNKLFGLSFLDLILRGLFSLLFSNLFLFFVNIRNDKMWEIISLAKKTIVPNR